METSPSNPPTRSTSNQKAPSMASTSWPKLPTSLTTCYCYFYHRAPVQPNNCRGYIALAVLECGLECRTSVDSRWELGSLVGTSKVFFSPIFCIRYEESTCVRVFLPALSVWPSHFAFTTASGQLLGVSRQRASQHHRRPLSLNYISSSANISVLFPNRNWPWIE